MSYLESSSQIEEEIKSKKPETYKQLFDILQVSKDSKLNNKNLISICKELGFILLPSTSLKDLRDFFAKNIEEGSVSKKLYILDFLYFVDICKIFKVTINIDKNVIKDYYTETLEFEEWYENIVIFGEKTPKQWVESGKGIAVLRYLLSLDLGIPA